MKSSENLPDTVDAVNEALEVLGIFHEIIYYMSRNSKCIQYTAFENKHLTVTFKETAIVANFSVLSLSGGFHICSFTFGTVHKSSCHTHDSPVFVCRCFEKKFFLSFPLEQQAESENLNS